MKIWFTSDLHFGHRNIINFCNRPFHDAFVEDFDGGPLRLGETAVAEMNEVMVEQWNSQVAEADHVYVLGDLAMGHMADSYEYVQRLKGIKHLVPGNHDRIWSGHDLAHRERFAWAYEGFAIEPESMVLAHLYRDGKRHPNVKLCHFPYAPAGDYDGRFNAHHPVDKGLWLLHGHVHDTWRQRGRQINVGIDAWGGRLISVEEIGELIDAGPQNLDAIPWREASPQPT